MKEHDFLKYLKRNPSEALAELAEFCHAVLIPAYDEEDNLPLLLESLASAEIPCPIAVVVAVNYPAGASADSSERLYSALQNVTLPSPLKLFTIFAPELVNGVGEARKLLFDTFCHSRTPENADTSVMFSLDADCLVHPQYFTETLETLSDGNAACAEVRVSHRKSGNPELDAAIAVYEKYLLDYERDLEKCGSPYAYNAIGSGFAVKVNCYIKCGGMKLKKAGEDFYFMQSAAKCSKIVKTDQALVYPSPRISERVPFGTGTAVRDIINGVMPRQVTDEAFDELKKVLDTVNIAGVLDSGEKFISSLSDISAEFFTANGFVQAWNRTLENQKLSSPAEKQRAFHIWFDALQTRRFLHHISGS